MTDQVHDGKFNELLVRGETIHWREPTKAVCVCVCFLFPLTLLHLLVLSLSLLSLLLLLAMARAAVSECYLSLH